MNPSAASIITFIRHTCRTASKAGHQLSLESTDTGHAYRWSHGIAGDTNAFTRPVALLMACLIYREINFTTFTTTV